MYHFTSMRQQFILVLTQLAPLVTLLPAVYGQTTSIKVRPDPSIKAMINEVSAKNIEATVRKLVSFGTRNTLSSQTDPKRGVGAARDFIYSAFQRISASCGGCLTVEKQA